MKLCPSCGARYEDAAKFCQHDGTLLRPAGGGEEEDPYVGQVLVGQFEVQELIGTGGMGRVYKARQLGFDRPAAIKILHKDLVTNQEMVKRFNREARIISRLDHPAIIHVYLFGELPDTNLYLAMEYVDGRPLTKLIAEGPVPPTRAIHIALQILGALEEAHGKGVVHRDLKPDNIMLVKRAGDPDTVKVLDFGIAKFLGSRTMLTQQGLVFGSARYISPEAAAGEDVDERADLYAVGVILYHMLAGEPPFDDPSAVTLLMRHVNDPAPQLLDKPGARAVPPPLGTAVMRALEKDPGSRYADAAAMRAALIEAAGRGGVPLPAAVAATAAQAPVAPARSASPPPEEPKRPPGFGTNPMYGGRAAEGPEAAPAQAGSPASSGAPTAAHTPEALDRASSAATAAAATGDGGGVASEPAEPWTASPYDDDDDPPKVPRSRAWIVLLVVGILALVGGAAAALIAIRDGGEAEASARGPGSKAPDAPGETPPESLATTSPTPSEEPTAVAGDGGAAEEGDGGLVAVAPADGDAGASGDAAPSTTGRDGGTTAPRDPSSGGMPPAASLRVHPSRPRAGTRVRIVAKVTPPSTLRSPRFVISKRGGGGEPTFHDAESGGEPGLYHLSHTFSSAGAYQITFVARSAHGELRAFADAEVSGRRADRPPSGEDEGEGGGSDEGGDEGDDAAHNADRDDDKPPGSPPPPVDEPWITPPPPPVPPPAPW